MLVSWAPSELLMLAGGAFLAGLVDAVVGGGGLISVPTLFAVFPSAAPPVLFGTNKMAGIWGTASAALRYARGVQLQWAILVPATLAAFVFSFCGAYAVTHIPADVLRKLLPFVLVGVAVYTLRKKDFGTVHAPVRGGAGVTLMAIAVGGAIGFYDGFFGPGTGSFLVFLFVRLFGQDFVNASASSKIVNVATNLAALWLFGMGGHVLAGGGRHGGHERAGQPGGQSARAQARRGLRAANVPVRARRADREDRLRRLFARLTVSGGCPDAARGAVPDATCGETALYETTQVPVRWATICRLLGRLMARMR